MSATEVPFGSLHLSEQPVEEAIGRFDRNCRAQILFHTFFFCLGFIELCCFLAFFALLTQSTVLAATLAVFFLTTFSYFVLRLYMQSKKPDLFMDICDHYLLSCKEAIRFQENIPEHHMLIAEKAQKFAKELEGREVHYLGVPRLLGALSASCEMLSGFCFWRDVHKIRELMLTIAIDEQLKVVKCEPTNLEVHAALANAYVLLSSLYADPHKSSDFEQARFLPKQRECETMQKKFRETARRAIEELKILKDYAPNDPWIHTQLAYSYHDLQMPEEEIAEYEKVLELKPNDKEVLFKLGMLYFQQGQNAEGLRIYEMLKRTNYKKAENLIKFYGS